MSAREAAVNIPTFVAELPPSPRSRRHLIHQSAATKLAADTNAAQLNEGLRLASVNAPIPSMILQESAEEDQSSANAGLRRTAPVMTSHSVNSTQGAAVTPLSSDKKPASILPPSAMPSAMVQVMLQLPGTDYQLPVNIPAETILPALTKYLPKLPPATVAVTTADSAAIISKPVAVKTDAGVSIPQTRTAQTSFPSGSKAVVPRPSEAVVPQTKVPRLSNTNNGTSTEPITPSHWDNKPPTSSFMSSSVSNVSDSDADDGSKPQQTNRNAATRCRQRKKMQVEKMEQKTKELQAQNKTLEAEMLELQKDITKLQSLLTEHSDCIHPSSTVQANQAVNSS